MRAVMVLALALVACGNGDNKDEQRREPAPPPQIDAAAEAAKAPPPVVIETFDTKGDEAKALRKARAMPAWRAVTRRWRLLARRGQSGAVWGRMGAAIDEHRWLIDETEGVGSLAIRTRLPQDASLDPGERVVMWGAWRVDAKRRWYWEARRVARLGGKSPGDAEVFPPGHEIQVLDGRPKGAVPISKLRRRGDVVFEVVNAPTYVGDGWIVADRAKWPSVALLYLPGERRVYGGQDYRTPDEKWNLEVGKRYTVKIRSYYPRKSGLQRMTAYWPPREIAKNKGK